ncbi:hypothetical protein O181_048775 [Austropuccinia psidii MF-1]|uniref:Uncharacterized protein n=1 Tax=Austropuccinia psidii MF-1 TaxID=1389203 RepID=A0A9Q3DXV3_9BASI|nr:hypothetical protein [Austropuccinia psidii MF-1]
MLICAERERRTQLFSSWEAIGIEKGCLRLRFSADGLSGQAHQKILLRPHQQIAAATKQAQPFKRRWAESTIHQRSLEVPPSFVESLLRTSSTGGLQPSLSRSELAFSFITPK